MPRILVKYIPQFNLAIRFILGTVKKQSETNIFLCIDIWHTRLEAPINHYLPKYIGM